jgi:hypothetical protein
LKDDGTTWYEDTTYCDASDSTSAVYIAKACQIPMTVLRSTTYGLDFGDVVYAKVKAHNERGWSAFSDVSATLTGATVQTEPATMNAPVNGSATSSSQV